MLRQVAGRHFQLTALTLRTRILVLPDWTERDCGISKEEKKSADVCDRSTLASDVYGAGMLKVIHVLISVQYKRPSPAAKQE